MAMEAATQAIEVNSREQKDIQNCRGTIDVIMNYESWSSASILNGIYINVLPQAPCPAR